MADIKTKKSEFFRDLIDFIFGFKNKRGEIWDHWITFFDNFSLAPHEFYASIEKQLDVRKFPAMEVSREEFAEGGLLSDKRIYLRLFRERLAIYTCAAPFGTGYFFSCRTVYVPALVRLWHILAAILIFGVVGIALQNLLGTIFAVIATIALIFALAGVMRNAAAAAVLDFDAFLLRIPIISTIYEDWFREETYYRYDTRLMFLKHIPELVREVAEDITAAKGVKLHDEFKRAPIYGKLYKRRRKRPTGEKNYDARDARTAI
jgi:hypothetical protein